MGKFTKSLQIVYGNKNVHKTFELFAINRSCSYKHDAVKYLFAKEYSWYTTSDFGI